jgi:hypothetical protein
MAGQRDAAVSTPHLGAEKIELRLQRHRAFHHHLEERTHLLAADLETPESLLQFDRLGSSRQLVRYARSEWDCGAATR